MVWFILKHIFSTFFDLINIRQLTNQEKDLEILVLRQQLSILQRKLNHSIIPSRSEKMTLAVLNTKLNRVYLGFAFTSLPPLVLSGITSSILIIGSAFAFTQ